MTDFYETLAARIEARFDAQVERIPSRRGELSYEVRKETLVEVAGALRDEFDFEQLMDLCGIDYLTYGSDEWTTESATERGFSRAVERASVVMDESDQFDPRRFAVVYHLLSLKNNARLRLRVYTGSDNPPVVASVVNVWNSANWFEREAFDLYGILFEGHPDLRRILTDYGFIGYPFRKDFPLIGAVEVLYDVEKGRVAYQPVTIEPRTLVPKVIRDDNRYRPELKERPHG
jgi:NADH-quinone oxidoreductase subunit C